MRQTNPQSHTPKKIFVLSMGGKCNNILLGLRSLCYNPCALHFSTITSNDNANFVWFLQYSITLFKSFGNRSPLDHLIQSFGVTSNTFEFKFIKNEANEPPFHHNVYDSIVLW